MDSHTAQCLPSYVPRKTLGAAAFGTLDFQLGVQEPLGAAELCESPRVLFLQMGGAAVLGPGRQLPGWEGGDVGLQACVLLPAERLKASPCACLSIRFVLHEMRGSGVP